MQHPDIGVELPVQPLDAVEICTRQLDRRQPLDLD
jgi:hypothetical protein